jgi:hypothetical protein
MRGFQCCLTQGQVGEMIVSKYLENKYKWENKGYGNTKDWDIHLTKENGEDVFIEVKTDRWEKFNKVTNNIFIETRCNNTPSGIWSSKSNLYAFYFPDDGEIFFIKTSDLKDLVKDPEKVRYTNMSGDGGRVSGFLINRKDWRDLFQVVNIGVLDYWKKTTFRK